MLSRFQQVISERSLFGKDEKLLAAVSGGADSVVLAHLLKKAGYNFSIAHCNFSLRGKESEADEQFVKQLAKKLKVQFFNSRFETKIYAKENKLSVQMAARELRYNLFRNLMTEHKFDLLVTAHHLNDNAETLLLNLTRGTGLKGITGIPEKENKTVRPLLSFSRDEIEAYAKKNRIAYRNDSSNYEEKYARNLIRLKVIPALKKINPSLERTFNGNIARFIQAEAILCEFVEEKKKKLVAEKGDEVRINAKKLRAEKNHSLLLFEILGEYNFTSSQQEIIERVLHSHAGKTVSSSTHTLITGLDELIIRKNRGSNVEPPEFTYEVTENKNFKFPADRNIACFDLDKMRGNMIVRKWRTGDRFRPFGMTGSKKLSDFFVNEKMSLFEKRDAWVMEAAGKIAWVVGRRISAEFAVDDSTKKILIVRKR